MDVRQLREIHSAFGYHKAGDIDEKGHVISSSDSSASNLLLKVGMCIPIINLIAIGIIVNVAKGELFTRHVGRLYLLRIVISLIAAPVLLPIDIIATVAIRALLKKAEKAVPA